MRWLGILAVALLAPTVNAAELLLGSVPIALGMDRMTATERMKRFREVKVVGDENTLFYLDGKTSIGGVSFANGRVVWASRNRGAFSEGESPILAGKAIAVAVEEITARSGPRASIATRAFAGPNANWNVMEIEFRDRTLKVTVQHSNELGDTLYVEEVIGKKPS